MSDKYLVCAPANAPRVVPGSIFDRLCAKCCAPLMVAPSGQKLLEQDASFVPICFACFAKGLDTDPRSEPQPNLHRHRN